MSATNDNLLGNIAMHYKPYYYVAFPSTARSTAEEADEVALLGTDLESFLDQYITKFIIGDLDIEENFDKFVDDVMAMGGARYVEIHQTIYDRWAHR